MFSRLCWCRLRSCELSPLAWMDGTASIAPAGCSRYLFFGGRFRCARDLTQLGIGGGGSAQRTTLSRLPCSCPSSLDDRFFHRVTAFRHLRTWVFLKSNDPRSLSRISRNSPPLTDPSPLQHPPFVPLGCLPCCRVCCLFLHLRTYASAVRWLFSKTWIPTPFLEPRPTSCRTSSASFGWVEF